MIYEKLLETIKKREQVEKEIQAAKQEFEQKYALKFALLNDLKDEETKLRQEVLLNLEKENEAVKRVEDKLIVKQAKVTNKIREPQQMLAAFLKDQEKLEKIGVDIKQVNSAVETELKIKDRKTIEQAIKNYENLFGSLPPGVEKVETKYIIVKKYEQRTN